MTTYSLDVLLSSLEPLSCSMSGCNCCFLTCIQISEEASKVIWHFHLLRTFPQFVVIFTVKGFVVINRAEVDVFLVFCCFFADPMHDGNLISGSSAFSKSNLIDHLEVHDSHTVEARFREF